MVSMLRPVSCATLPIWTPGIISCSRSVQHKLWSALQSQALSQTLLSHFRPLKVNILRGMSRVTSSDSVLRATVTLGNELRIFSLGWAAQEGSNVPHLVRGILV